MSDCSSEDDLPRILARAFAQVCERYLQDEGHPVSEGVARSLKHHLVSMVREGVKDERSLTAGGLMHLMWLGDELPQSSGLPDDNTLALNKGTAIRSKNFQFRSKCTNARFLRQYRFGSTVFEISADVLA
jgi:hypothetical protein